MVAVHALGSSGHLDQTFSLLASCHLSFRKHHLVRTVNGHRVLVLPATAQEGSEGGRVFALGSHVHALVVVGSHVTRLAHGADTVPQHVAVRQLGRVNIVHSN